jgi:hypothetical protein
VVVWGVGVCVLGGEWEGGQVVVWGVYGVEGGEGGEGSGKGGRSGGGVTPPGVAGCSQWRWG